MDNGTNFVWEEISTNAWEELDCDDSRVSHVDPKKNAEKKKKKKKRAVIHFEPVNEGNEKESPDSADRKLSVSILYWTIVIWHICFVMIQLWFISFYRNLQSTSHSQARQIKARSSD
jgi:hypothetical protein